MGERTLHNVMPLLLVPAEPLVAGRHELTVPTDSMYGGVTRHFFRIE